MLSNVINPLLSKFCYGVIYVCKKNFRQQDRDKLFFEIATTTATGDVI
jgi:hypothetical protein